MEEQIREKDKIIKALMTKVGIIEGIKENIENETFQPISRYMSLEEKIRLAESKDREEYYKVQQDADKI